MARAAGWSLARDEEGLWIAVGGPRPLPVAENRRDQVVIIGDLFASQAGSNSSMRPTPDMVCRSLTADGWGRYVALFPDPTGSFRGVFRDPSGAVDCAIWHAEGLDLAASCLPDWLTMALPMRTAIDWSIIADQLRDPTLLTGPIALQGVVAVPPGDLFDVVAKTSVPIWRPVHAASSPRADAASRLRPTVDLAVQTASAPCTKLLVEVSGGLDSAIIAGSVQAAGQSARCVWLNAWGPFAEADERAYAQSVSDHLGIPLLHLQRRLPIGSGGVCLSHPQALRPSLNRMDVLYDSEQAALCTEFGVDGVVTGKGGDVAFFQTATSAILADRIRSSGMGALFDPMADVLARRLRRSRWSVLRSALSKSRSHGRDGLGRPALDFTTSVVQERVPEPHPWLAGLDRLPPAKRMQVMNFTSNLALHGLCKRTEAADLIHPLLSQPVLELTLALPVHVLTGGGHDRLLARQVFADRVPQMILRRRSKGELGTYYGRSIANALSDLRPHLLEGRLTASGLIDRCELEAALSVDHLIWQGGYADLMILATMESWIQAWSGPPSSNA